MGDIRRKAGGDGRHGRQPPVPFWAHQVHLRAGPGVFGDDEVGESTRLWPQPPGPFTTADKGNLEAADRCQPTCKMMLKSLPIIRA